MIQFVCENYLTNCCIKCKLGSIIREGHFRTFHDAPILCLNNSNCDLNQYYVPKLVVFHAFLWLAWDSIRYGYNCYLPPAGKTSSAVDVSTRYSRYTRYSIPSTTLIANSGDKNSWAGNAHCNFSITTSPKYCVTQNNETQETLSAVNKCIWSSFDDKKRKPNSCCLFCKHSENSQI